MNIAQRVTRLEKHIASLPEDTFVITHEDFMTLMLAEIALRYPEKHDVNNNPAAAATEIRRIDRIRRHPRKIIDDSAYLALSRQEQVKLRAAAIMPRMRALQTAYEANDCIRSSQRKQKRKTGMPV